jgi:hypothetical protein
LSDVAGQAQEGLRQRGHVRPGHAGGVGDAQQGLTHLRELAALPQGLHGVLDVGHLAVQLHGLAYGLRDALLEGVEGGKGTTGDQPAS